ncbi:MAG: hypothetical protein WCO71_09825 [Pseudomonadota bacterium]
MAAASDDEDANYWPGFVDALSTMTMMLIFLMMILSLVVVSISQSASLSQVLTIAKAARVDIQGAPASIEKLTAQILEALSRNSDPPNTQLPVPETTEQQATQIVQPSAKLDVAENPNFSIEKGSKTASQGVEDSLLSNARAAEDKASEKLDESTTPSDSPPKSSQTAELDAQAGKYFFAAPQPNPAESRIVSRRPADLLPFGGGADVKANKAMVTIEFQPRAIRVDDASAGKLQNFLTARKGDIGDRSIQVRALANVRNGAVTEARRFSYYRAMGVRQFLIDSGIPKDRISVGIEDVSDPEKIDIVELFAG